MVISIRVIELFSGIGAWRRALEELDIVHETVLAVEQDKLTMDCYNALHKNNFDECDVENMELDNIPNADVIFYSPPCQTFSSVGRQQGMNDKRGLLFYDALKIIHRVKPKYAIMENVIGLTNKFKLEFDDMLKGLKEAGYNNYWKVISSNDYGYPQSRRRVFVVSIRSDIESSVSFKSKVNKNIKLKDYLVECNDERYYIESKEWMQNLLANLNINENQDGQFPISFTRKKIKYTEMCNTILSNPPLKSLGSNTPITGVLESYANQIRVRILTPLESWRINGFRDEDYYNAKKVVEQRYSNINHIDGKLYKLAGNSIDVGVLMEIYKEVFKYISV